MRILYITDYLPYPLISGDRIRVYNLARLIASQHQLTVLALLGTTDDTESLRHLASFCHRVETADFRWTHPLRLLPRFAKHALTGIPVSLGFLYSKVFADRIRQLTAAEEFDVINIEHARMAFYLRDVAPGMRARRFLTLHNIESRQYHRIARIERHPAAKMRAALHSVEMRRWECRFAEQYDCCVAVSEADRRALLDANPRLRIAVIAQWRRHATISAAAAEPNATRFAFRG